MEEVKRETITKCWSQLVKVILSLLFSPPKHFAENLARKEWELDARIIINKQEPA